MMESQLSVLKEGWLYKAPRPSRLAKFLSFIKKPKWRCYYFVLGSYSGSIPGTQDHIVWQYFSDETKSKKCGSVKIANCDELVSDLDCPGYPFAFGMNEIMDNGRERTHYFASHSFDEMKRWEEVFRQYCGFIVSDILGSPSLSPTDQVQLDISKNERQLQEIGNERVIIRPCPADQVHSDLEFPPQLPGRDFVHNDGYGGALDDTYGVPPSQINRNLPVPSARYVNLGNGADSISPACNSRVQIVNNLSNSRNRGSASSSHLPKTSTVGTPRSTASSTQLMGMVKVNYGNFNLSSSKGLVKKDIEFNDDDLYQKPNVGSKKIEEEDDDDEMYVAPQALKKQERVVEEAYAITTTDRSMSLKRPVPPPRLIPTKPTDRDSTGSSESTSTCSDSNHSRLDQHPPVPSRPSLQQKSEKSNILAAQSVPKLAFDQLDYSELDSPANHLTSSSNKSYTFNGWNSNNSKDPSIQYTKVDEKRTHAANSALRSSPWASSMK